ncbi:fasciclin-1 [Galendromus occidentalis]|uniref:Fasciclin-1 n=1 Tax=Galendromus occidentalis TaxID=34638 RepID=A0AAJ7WHE3_9ACAR|nr:fasciclin-1 [Galendromus occidentalis]
MINVDLVADSYSIIGVMINVVVLMKSIALIVLLGLVGLARGDLIQLLGKEAELSIFKESLYGATWLSFVQDDGKITVFAPTNHAIELFDRLEFERQAEAHKKSFLRNFFVQARIRTEELPDRSGSFQKASPLFYTKKWEDGQEKVYVNEAQIIRQAAGTEDITIYLIDRVPNFKQFENVPPSAKDLLKDLDKLFGLKGLSVDGFRSRVEKLKLWDLFATQRGTFFFPMIESPDSRLTEEIVQAHVIPGKVLFTPHFQHERFFTATRGEGGRRFQISLVNETDNHISNQLNDRSFIPVLVKSTSVGNKPGEKTSIVSRLHLANVPVENGVVHFIGAPLGFPTKSVWDYLQNEKESLNRFNNFVDIVRNSVEFKNELRRADRKTLFIPSNHAISVLPADVWSQYKSNQSELTKLLKYHLVQGQTITEDSLRSSSSYSPTFTAANVPIVVREIQCTSGCTFNSGANRSILVECAGVNATVLSSDIGVSDGVIHIIDRVLGAPSHSLGWKLQNEEPLATTQAVATKGHWNKKLDNPNSHFTLFAPNNYAWRQISKSDYNRLVRQPSELHDQAAGIMNRHLVNSQLSRDELLKLSELRTVRGDTIRLSHDNDQIKLAWGSRQCSVLNSDIHATNGVIHIIDCVLMESDDLVSTARAVSSSISVVLAGVVAAIFFIGRH